MCSSKALQVVVMPCRHGSAQRLMGTSINAFMLLVQGFKRKLPDFKSMLEAALRGDLPPSAAAWPPPAPLSARSRESAYSDLGASASVVAERVAESGRGRAAATSPSSVVSQAAVERSLARTSSDGSGSPSPVDGQTPDAVAHQEQQV